jgi:hypothetical protein
MRKLSIFALVLAVLLTALSPRQAAAAYRIGGRWLTSGGGFAEKGFVRISLNNNGVLTFRSTLNGGVERVTGYNMYGELNATGFNINAWRQSDDHDYAIPIEVRDFNPSMSNPFVMPTFAIGKLTYTVIFTDVNSGTIRLRGYIDVDGVGECEVNADNAIWREGTSRPNVPDTESGCNTGAGPLALFAPALGLLLRRGARSRKAKVWARDF